MKNLLRLEELAMAAAGIFLLYHQPLSFPVSAWVLLFLSPDIGMLGYLITAKVGAYSYNVLHHKGVAVATVALGIFLSSDLLVLAGLLLFSHASFDRIFGYGLKYPDSFKHTHLGEL